MPTGPRALADTGAIVAFLDRDDRWHIPCVSAFSGLPLPLGTTAAVLAEVFHLLDLHHHGRAWEFLRSGAFTVIPVGDDDLPEIDELMHRYRDRPMDFADATLVRAARRHALSTVFTIDHNDFETYRIVGTKRFRIVPARHVAR